MLSSLHSHLCVSAKGDIKINETDGAIEICYTNGDLEEDCRSVCDIGWSNRDARVACKELGCSSDGR